MKFKIFFALLLSFTFISMEAQETINLKDKKKKVKLLFGEGEECQISNISYVNVEGGPSYGKKRFRIFKKTCLKYDKTVFHFTRGKVVWINSKSSNYCLSNGLKVGDFYSKVMELYPDYRPGKAIKVQNGLLYIVIENGIVSSLVLLK